MGIMTNSNLPTLMTFSAVARKLDIPLPRASRLLSEGILRPDYRLGERVLFLETRVPEIRREILRTTHKSNPL